MKVSDLKTGMVIEFDGGLKSRMLTTSFGDFIIGEGYETEIDEYTNIDFSEWTNKAKVIRVLEPRTIKEHSDLTGSIVWERSLPEFTMEELSIKLGFNFKIKK